MQYGFCNPGVLRAELGVPTDAQQLTIHVLPTRQLSRQDLELNWEVDCNE